MSSVAAIPNAPSAAIPAAASSEPAGSSVTSLPSITVDEKTYPLPADTTMRNACKLSIELDKKIQMDYWIPSMTSMAFLGLRPNKEKILIKPSVDEYTSAVVKLFKTTDEYIVITENSIYIVSNRIPLKKLADRSADI